MKALLSLTLLAALCVPAVAQRQGSSNSNAPEIKQSIAAGEAKISLNYTSITWASGRTMTALMDKEKGGRTRERVNGNAAGNPLAAFTTSVPLQCGDLHLPAGDYKVFFTIGDDLAWSINFMMGDKTMTMKLNLMDSGMESKRLLLCLYAGDDDGAGVYVSFGKQMTMLAFKPEAAKTEK